MADETTSFSAFARTCHDFWNSYFTAVENIYRRGATAQLFEGNPIAYFPTIVLATELPHHYAVELIGGRKTNRELKLKKHHVDDPDLYFGQFAGKPDGGYIVRQENEDTGLIWICLMAAIDEDEMNERFPGVLGRFKTKLGPTIGRGEVTALGIGETANFVRLENCLLVNKRFGIVRIRDIREVVLVKKTTSNADLLAYLRRTFTPTPVDVVAWCVPEGQAEVVLQAAQFSNVYLLNQLRETTIGSFLRDHDQILRLAMDAQAIKFECSLKWQVPVVDENEVAIQPDLFVQRSDGFWDIWDLKLPLLESKKLTTGKRQRRRFVKTIEDGIAQLMHYREYFEEPANREYARRQYGLDINEPRFGLIVGNFENFDSQPVTEALRRFPDLQILTYDAIAQMFIAKSTGS